MVWLGFDNGGLDCGVGDGKRLLKLVEAPSGVVEVRSKCLWLSVLRCFCRLKEMLGLQIGLVSTVERVVRWSSGDARVEVLVQAMTCGMVFSELAWVFSFFFFKGFLL